MDLFAMADLSGHKNRHPVHFPSCSVGPHRSDVFTRIFRNMSNVQKLFGPLLIGVVLNAILYGILLVQSFMYFRTYRKDSARLRYFVLFLVLCDTVNTVFDIGVIYEPLIFRYGTLRATERLPIMLPINPLITAIISTSVQSFTCWRIKIITKSWLISGFIGVFIFSSLVGGVATCICGLIFDDFSRLRRIDGAVITWLVASAIADISITISLVVSLTKRRTGNVKTDDAIDRIIRLTIHTGAVTALFATLDMVLFVAIPNSTFNFAFDLPLAKLYTNSLLSTLNARGGWYDTPQQPDDNVIHTPLSCISDKQKETDMDMHSQITTMSSCVFVSPLAAPAPVRHPQQGEKVFNIDLESAGGVNRDGSENWPHGLNT